MLPNDWDFILKDEIKKPYFKEMFEFIETDSEKYFIYPKREDVFNAFKYTSFKDTKVVILGQDPYHGGQAHGLSFSVNKETKIPMSLQNIFKELHDDLGCYVPNNGYLKKWADQGVLLLNAVLTVRAHCPGSHSDIGWEAFTNQIIREINKKDDPVVFILWGNYAKSKGSLISDKHLVLTSTHPSPFSANRGFFGSKPFSKTNSFLEKNNLEPIDWQIENI